MAVTYTYAFNGLRVVTQDALSDVVREIDVNVWGADGDVTFWMAVTVKLPDADASSFTPFESISLEQATTWVDESALTSHAKEHIANVIARRIEEAAMVAKPIPWAS